MRSFIRTHKRLSLGVLLIVTLALGVLFSMGAPWFPSISTESTIASVTQDIQEQEPLEKDKRGKSVKNLTKEDALRLVIFQMLTLGAR